MIIEKMNEYLGSEYEIDLRKVSKNNGVMLDGMTVRREGENAAPTYYLNSLYDAYENGASFESVFEHLKKSYDMRHEPGENDVPPLSADIFDDFENIRSRVLFKLINVKKNRKLLDEVPHIMWNDLAIVFFYSYPQGTIGNATVLLRNEHIEGWNVTVDDLIKCSSENMPKAAPDELVPLSQLIDELMCGSSNHTHDDKDEGHVPMYVLSNSDRMFGAAAMIYSKRIGMLAEHVGHNLFILPSSIHEVILMPDDGDGDPEYLKSTIREINDTQVDPEEVLSNQLYYFDRRTQKITVA